MSVLHISSAGDHGVLFYMFVCPSTHKGSKCPKLRSKADGKYLQYHHQYFSVQLYLKKVIRR